MSPPHRKRVRSCNEPGHAHELTHPAIQLLGDHALDLVIQKPTGPPLEFFCEASWACICR
jgi:hypothetical protein